MKKSAQALNAALGKKQKGVAEANALLKGSAAMIDATLKLPPNSSAAAAWSPVRDDLAKIALGYEALIAGPQDTDRQGRQRLDTSARNCAWTPDGSRDHGATREYREEACGV